jgi:hypothetical protein
LFVSKESTTRRCPASDFPLERERDYSSKKNKIRNENNKIKKRRRSGGKGKRWVKRER